MDKQKNKKSNINPDLPVDDLEDYSDIDKVIKKLKKKQRKFAQAYVKDFNKTHAALAVGYKQCSAGSMGNAIYKDRNVQKYINYLLHQVRQQGLITRQDLLRRADEIFSTYRGGTVRMSALNFLAKISGHDNTVKESIFGDNNQIVINITKKSNTDT